VVVRGEKKGNRKRNRQLIDRRRFEIEMMVRQEVVDPGDYWGVWKARTPAKRHAEKPEHGDRFSSGPVLPRIRQVNELDRLVWIDE
jgi:hypothetical protein